MLTRRSKTRSTKTEGPAKALVSSTFYSFDESGTLIGSSTDKDHEST
jgi:hypothetical protein